MKPKEDTQDVDSLSQTSVTKRLHALHVPLGCAFFHTSRAFPTALDAPIEIPPFITRQRQNGLTIIKVSSCPYFSQQHDLHAYISDLILPLTLTLTLITNFSFSSTISLALMFIRGAWGQSFPSETPRLTEKNLPSQAGKIFLVTGGNSGLGFELVKVLYGAGATVYLAARSQKGG